MPTRKKIHKQNAKMSKIKKAKDMYKVRKAKTIMRGGGGGVFKNALQSAAEFFKGNRKVEVGSLFGRFIKGKSYNSLFTHYNSFGENRHTEQIIFIVTYMNVDYKPLFTLLFDATNDTLKSNNFRKQFEQIKKNLDKIELIDFVTNLDYLISYLKYYIQNEALPTDFFKIQNGNATQTQLTINDNNGDRLIRAMLILVFIYKSLVQVGATVDKLVTQLKTELENKDNFKKLLYNFIITRQGAGAKEEQLFTELLYNFIRYLKINLLKIEEPKKTTTPTSAKSAKSVAIQNSSSSKPETDPLAALAKTAEGVVTSVTAPAAASKPAPRQAQVPSTHKPAPAAPKPVPAAPKPAHAAAPKPAHAAAPIPAPSAPASAPAAPRPEPVPSAPASAPAAPRPEPVPSAPADAQVPSVPTPAPAAAPKPAAAPAAAPRPAPVPSAPTPAANVIATTAVKNNAQRNEELRILEEQQAAEVKRKAEEEAAEAKIKAEEEALKSKKAEEATAAKEKAEEEAIAASEEAARQETARQETAIQETEGRKTSYNIGESEAHTISTEPPPIDLSVQTANVPAVSAVVEPAVANTPIINSPLAAMNASPAVSNTPIMSAPVANETAVNASSMNTPPPVMNTPPQVMNALVEPVVAASANANETAVNAPVELEAALANAMNAPASPEGETVIELNTGSSQAGGSRYRKSKKSRKTKSRHSKKSMQSKYHRSKRSHKSHHNHSRRRKNSSKAKRSRN